jgi:hypothetical protein
MVITFFEMPMHFIEERLHMVRCTPTCTPKFGTCLYDKPNG